MNANAREFIPSCGLESVQRSESAFHFFNDLNEELKLNILTFVVDVPYEYSSTMCASMLTSILPFISHQFNIYCKSRDFLWEICIQRLMVNESNVWATSLAEFTECSVSEYTSSELLEKGCMKIEHLIESDENIQRSRVYGSHGELFRFILVNYIKYESPLFYMPDNSVIIGQEFGIHFFEPRYRRLIREVMSPHLESFQGGRAITEENGLVGKPPTFIYAHRSPLKKGNIACVVQVLECSIHPDGRADVLLRPIHYVRITQVYEQEIPRDHLYFCKTVRLSEHEEYEYETDSLRSFAERIAHSSYAVHGHGIPFSDYIELIFNAIERDRNSH
jgi:hypothetical protein